MNRFFIDYNQLKTLDKDLIRLYHEEAGKRMADLKEIESLITDKAYRLFSIYYAVEIAVVGYVLTQIDKTRDMGLINAGMAIVVFTAISLWYVVKVMRPHGVMPAGQITRKTSKSERTAGILKKTDSPISTLISWQGS